MANMARRFDDAGADALVLFNRFYQPDIDLGKLDVALTPTLSLTFAFFGHSEDFLSVDPC
jgi:dihydroorotate dehydrogenase (fumarate)